MKQGEVKLTESMRALLEAMGDAPNALKNSDEQSPRWYIEGGCAVRRKVADAVIRRGYVQFTGKWGGHPGVLGFTRTPAGLAALSKEGRGHE